MWADIILLQNSSKNALKERNDFGLKQFTDMLVAVQIPTSLSSCDYL